MDRKLITIALILFTFSLSAQLKSGLVGYWKFENNALDATMHDNDGTVTGATYNSSGKVGGCYDFNGSNDYVSMGDVLDFDQNNAFSTSVWVNVDNYNFQSIVGKMISSGTYIGWLVNLRSESTSDRPRCIQFMLRHDHTTRNLISVYGNEQILTTGGWYHIVVTYDGSGNGSGVNFYVNGNVDSNLWLYSDALNGTTINSAPFNVGARNNNSWFFDGKIDEVMIYRRALTSDEVKSLYKLGNGVYFVMENFRNDKNYEKLNKYFISRMYYDWIEGAA